VAHRSGWDPRAAHVAAAAAPAPAEPAAAGPATAADAPVTAAAAAAAHVAADDRFTYVGIAWMCRHLEGDRPIAPARCTLDQLCHVVPIDWIEALAGVHPFPFVKGTIAGLNVHWQALLPPGARGDRKWQTLMTAMGALPQPRMEAVGGAGAGAGVVFTEAERFIYHCSRLSGTIKGGMVPVDAQTAHLKKAQQVYDSLGEPKDAATEALASLRAVVEAAAAKAASGAARG